MNNLSFSRHLKIILLHLFSYLLITNCYSFTGSSVPEHLKTIQIPTVDDVSGFGDARYRDILTTQLIAAFRSDNSLIVVPNKADALLTITINNIAESTVSINPGELEKERKITVTVNVVYNDLVKKIKKFERPFSRFQNYSVSEGFQARDAAIQNNIKQLSRDILLAVVSDW